jgi:deoxyadenosine/deoxycytidine kinase
LLIYLKAPVPVLLQRIQIRGRAIEAGIDAAYLSLLDRLYEEWTSSFDLCPILTIQSDAVDFVNREEQLDLIATRVLDRLTGSEKIVLE